MRKQRECPHRLLPVGFSSLMAYCVGPADDIPPAPAGWSAVQTQKANFSSATVPFFSPQWRDNLRKQASVPYGSEECLQNNRGRIPYKGLEASRGQSPLTFHASSATLSGL